MHDANSDCSQPGAIDVMTFLFTDLLLVLGTPPPGVPSVIFPDEKSSMEKSLIVRAAWQGRASPR